MLDSLFSGFEHPPCTICQGKQIEHFIWGDYNLNLDAPIQVAKCRNCGMIFLSPRPDRRLRLELMEGNVPQELKTYSKDTASYYAVTGQRSLTFRKRLDQINTIWKGAARLRYPCLLDIGASAGTFVQLAAERGWQSFGIEPSRSGAHAAFSQGLFFPIGVAESLPFADETFDIVHSHHVFEHLADPMLAARESWRVLKPGGLFFIEVPNQFDNVMFRRDIIFRRVPQRQRNIRSIHHLWFFGRSTLQQLLTRAGFQKVQVHDFFGGPRVGWRIPFALATRLVGRLAYGGDFLNAWGWKDN